MRYLLCLFALTLWATSAPAQDTDSVFRDYDDYATFVDQAVMQRAFIPLIQRLGGRDEYTPEQLAATQDQMKRAWPRNFTNMSVFRKQDLGGGLIQEGRMYWTGKSYAFYYALLHQRPDDLAVITFTINSNSKVVMERF